MRERGNTMFEKVNPCHPDKVADRIAGALVDLAYKSENPRIAVEVLIGHGVCHIIAETSVMLDKADVTAAVHRIAGNLAGVIAFLQDAVLVIAAYAADISIAGNLAGVVAVQHTPYVITPLVRTADTADSIACTFSGGTVLYGATIVPPADVTDIHFPGHIGIRDGDIFHGAARANAAEQTNVVLIDINVQPSDGVTVAVKCANKRTV